MIDDASRDGTAEAASRYGVTVLRLSRNSGPGVARNAGAALARGDILAFTDSDCVAPAGWLAALVAALEAPGVVAATGGYAGPVRDTFLTRLQYLVLRQRQSGLPAHIESAITSNFACARAAYLAAGGFPLYFRRLDPATPVWGNEDEELGFLLARAGGRIRWLPETGVLHEFRHTLGGYLRQQLFYAERVVLSHFRFPAMAASRSNYNRLSGATHLAAALGVVAGLAAVLGATATGAGWMQWPAALLLGVSLPAYLLLPAGTLAGLKRQGQGWRFIAKSYPVLLAVDIAWLAGAVSGTLMSIGGFGNGNRESGAALAAPDQ